MSESTGPIHRKVIDLATAATHEIIPADPQGRAIRILALYLRNNHASTDVVVTVQDDAGTPNVMFGPATLAPKEDFILPAGGFGWADSAPGKSIDLISDGTERVTGNVVYQFVGSRGPVGHTTTTSTTTTTT